jgi:hypothetical protein
MATDTSDREQQQRELEEIRRKFQEVSARLGSAFEPAPPDDEEDKDVRSTRPALPAPKQAKPWTRPPSWLVAASVSLVFLLGIGFGYLLPRANVEDSAARTPTRSATTLAPQATPQPQVSVPPACLETARKGDEVFALLSSNVRANDRRLAEAMKAYTLASQACRKEASP